MRRFLLQAINLERYLGLAVVRRREAVLVHEAIGPGRSCVTIEKNCCAHDDLGIVGARENCGGRESGAEEVV